MVGYYIKRGLKRAARFAETPNNIGETEQDYKDGKWIDVSEQQAAFFAEYPYAQFDEITNTALIRRRRRPKSP